MIPKEATKTSVQLKSTPTPIVWQASLFGRDGLLMWKIGYAGSCYIIKTVIILRIKVGMIAKFLN